MSYCFSIRNSGDVLLVIGSPTLDGSCSNQPYYSFGGFGWMNSMNYFCFIRTSGDVLLVIGCCGSGVVDG
jgi:hypothetical protein